jgi:predicted RNase H-like HicB family nuclease
MSSKPTAAAEAAPASTTATAWTIDSAPKAQTVMRKHYIALVLKDEDSRFGISFPDFPGAVTAAPTLDEAFERAEEALAQHVEGMAEHGEPIPPPSGFTEVIKDNPDAMPVLVPLPLAKAVR